MNPYEYVKAASYSKKNIMVDDVAEKAYVPYIVNRALSYHLDTVLFANEMNINHTIDNKLQFSFYINTIKKRNRFSKWHKVIDDNDINIIMQAFNYNKKRAEEVLSLLNKDQIQSLKNRMNIGGKR
tara:strand:+ start:1227 stop:1604 length:378 start_codon:yes stop_codon:yes gene_type:complete